MRKNKFTYVFGRGVILVSYKKEHVQKYHEWMQNSLLRDLTGSELLNLEQEYAMCQTWQDDENKCTFIILSAKRYLHKNGLPTGNLINSHNECTYQNLSNDGITNNVFVESDNIDLDNCSFNCGSLNTKSNEVNSMIGDINLFISDDDNKLNGIKRGEINLMIAEPCYRRMGLGQEALLLMLKYGIEILEISHYFAKIQDTNLASINMFKKVGFQQTDHSKVFHETTLELSVTKGFAEWLLNQTKESHIVDKTFNSQCMKFCFAAGK